MHRLSPLEEVRFGIRTVRAETCSQQEIHALVQYCRETQAKLAIVRCPVGMPDVAQKLEDAGFRLMDTHVSYERSLRELPPSSGPAFCEISPADAGDAGCVEAIARECFNNYVGHYHADPRLDRTACDEVYAAWARRCWQARDGSHEVFAAYVDRNAVGFLSVELEHGGAARVPLNAVLPEYRRQGIYTGLLVRGMHWSAERGAIRLRISTQLSNVAVQTAWTRLGFGLTRAEYTFHRWFDT